MRKDVGSVAKIVESGKQTEEYFFKNYKEKFFRAVKWNTVESIGYQVIFMFHQCGLFWYCDRSLYGKIGALLAACYLGVTVLVAGFDGGLFPFFERFTATKQDFKRFIFEKCILHLCCMVGIVALIGIIFFISNQTFSRCSLFLVGLFVLIEASKKILKQLLYLGFYNKQVALFEVIQIGLYSATIWSCYIIGIPFSISLFLIPFIVYSAVFCLFCMWSLKNYYQTLPSFANTMPLTLTSFSFSYLRVAVLINQLSRAFFSSNFLVPLFAIHDGFKEVGLLTFINYLTHACTFIIQKITLPPTEALFSRIKKLSFVAHRKAFSLVFTLFLSLTLLFGFLFFFKGRSLITSFGYNRLDHVTWKLLVFFFFIHLLESGFMLYEKFFLLQERLFFLALGNVVACIFCYILYFLHLPFFILIFSCIFMRFSFFILLSFLIYSSKLASRASFRARS